jgi:hypothetical protein
LSIPLFGQSGCTGGCGLVDVFAGDLTSFTNINKYAYNLFLDNTSSPYGSFDTINSLSGSTNLQIIQNYTLVSSNYVLKLFIPGVTSTNDSYNGYKFEFNLTSGQYDSLAANNTFITDCYIDSDGDGIPDAWDNAPDYPDVDGDGILDGQQTSISPISPALSDSITSPPETVTASDSLIIATPLKIDGTPNSSIKSDPSLKSFSPAQFSIDLGLYNNALYFKKDATTYIRKMPIMTTLAEREKFINGTISGSTINLNMSRELDALENGAFKTANKVTH